MDPTPEDETWLDDLFEDAAADEDGWEMRMIGAARLLDETAREEGTPQ